MAACKMFLLLNPHEIKIGEQKKIKRNTCPVHCTDLYRNIYIESINYELTIRLENEITIFIFAKKKIKFSISLFAQQIRIFTDL